jgi:cation transport regulator ChaB
MYESIHDLPVVCQLNLPEAALKVYREAFNRAWSAAAEEKSRYQQAQERAWSAVRREFEREKETGRWVRRTAAPERRVVRTVDVEEQRAAR